MPVGNDRKRSVQRNYDSLAKKKKQQEGTVPGRHLVASDVGRGLHSPHCETVKLRERGQQPSDTNLTGETS